MPRDRFVDVGVVTDELSRDLAEAFEISAGWGLTKFELREGNTGRFPDFTPEEISMVEAVRTDGASITAVSPGILKGHVDDENRLKREIENVLPRAIDLGARFEAPTIIVFGFERYEGEPDANRDRAAKVFERVAEAADEAGMIVAVENEPNFWIDRPIETAALLDAVGHPSLRANWDPANLHWGGRRPTYDDFRSLLPHIANVHVKDYYPEDPGEPWRPVGDGSTPWGDLLSWIVLETNLGHVTLETHCKPLLESSRRSVTALRRMLSELEKERSSHDG